MLDLDTSQIDFSKEPDGISLKEVISVFENERSRVREILGFPKLNFYNVEAGYGSKKRILLIASRIIDNKRQLLQIKVADENEIDEYYCNG
ncbi:hypothetical protein BH23BAC1_BH23BAC1_25750 [soil metagenome]